MKKQFVPSKIEFVMFDGSNVIRTSDCDFDCVGNCSCHFCVGVCTWDCTADDSTCTNADFNPSQNQSLSEDPGIKTQAVGQILEEIHLGGF